MQTLFQTIDINHNSVYVDVWYYTTPMGANVKRNNQNDEKGSRMVDRSNLPIGLSGTLWLAKRAEGYETGYPNASGGEEPKNQSTIRDLPSRSRRTINRRYISRSHSVGGSVGRREMSASWPATDARSCSAQGVFKENRENLGNSRWTLSVSRSRQNCT